MSICISLNDDKRCDARAKDGSRFCEKHSVLYKPLYLKYKLLEKSVLHLILKSDSTDDLDVDLTILYRYYNRLKKVYEMRRGFRIKAVHPSAWDQDHEIHSKRILRAINVILGKIKEKYAEHNTRIIEIPTTIEVSESIEDENVGEVSTISLEQDYTNVTTAAEDSEADQVVDIEKENLYLQQMIIESNTKRLNLMNTHLLEILNMIEELKEKFEKEEPSIDYSQKFLSFIILKITPLSFLLSHFLCDENVNFIRTSPLRRVGMDRLTYLEVARIGQKEFISGSHGYDKIYLKRLHELFLEGEERGFLVYRYYKPAYGAYSITFLTGKMKPFLINVKLKEDNNNGIMWLSEINQETKVVPLLKHFYANYTDKFTNKHEFISLRASGNWTDKDGRRTCAYLSVLWMEYVTCGEEIIADHKEIIYKIYRRRTAFDEARHIIDSRLWNGIRDVPNLSL
jgi:hypothetical protein